MDKTHLIYLLELEANYTGVVDACQYVKGLLPQHPKGKNIYADMWSDMGATKEHLKQSEDELLKLMSSEHTRENRNKAVHLTFDMANERGWLAVYQHIFYRFRTSPSTPIEELKLLDDVSNELDDEIKQYTVKLAEVIKEREELL